MCIRDSPERRISERSGQCEAETAFRMGPSCPRRAHDSPGGSGRMASIGIRALTMRIILASASPARLATLRSAGINPEVIASGVDESTVQDSDSARLAIALAELKCRAVACLLYTSDAADDLT